MGGKFIGIDARFAGQHLQAGFKIQPVVFHGEGNEIAGFFTAEAVKKSFLGRNGKGRGFFVVEGATAEITDPLFFQGYKAVNVLLNGNNLEYFILESHGC